MKSFNIVIFALVAFMSYIVFLVIGTMKTNVDLEYVDYYQKEISYQTQIDAQKNTENLKKQPLVFSDKGVIYVELPGEQVEVKGNVNIYRLSNAKDDFSAPLKGQYTEISLLDKQKGLYRVEIEWEDNGKPFFYKSEVNL
jgi:hypothetical protein